MKRGPVRLPQIPALLTATRGTRSLYLKSTPCDNSTSSTSQRGITRRNDLTCSNVSVRLARKLSSGSYHNQERSHTTSINAPATSNSPEPQPPPASAHDASINLQDPSSTQPSKTSAIVTTPAPTSPLSIVFTDVVKSTNLWESNTRAMSVALSTHDEIIRAVTDATQGYEVKQNGDGFMIAFASALRALQFCLDVQQRLLETKWPEELLQLPPGRERSDEDGKVLFRGLRLRMSAHWGHAVCNFNNVIGRMDYLGPMVNRAARFIQVTEGGQIVVSEEFLEELGRLRSNGRGGEVLERSELGPIWERARAVTSVENADQVKTLQPESRANAVVADLEDLSPSPESMCEDAEDKVVGRDSGPLDHEFEVRLLGKHQFKGIDEPQKLYFIIPRSLRGRLDHFPRHTHVPGSKGNLLPDG